jgi:hypothetical protein
MVPDEAVIVPIEELSLALEQVVQNPDDIGLTVWLHLLQDGLRTVKLVFDLLAFRVLVPVEDVQKSQVV